MGGEEVSGIIGQWPILGVFVAGLVVAAAGTIAGFKIFGSKSDGKSAPAGDQGAILNAITGITKEIADQGRSTIEHLDSVAGRLEKRLADHEERDNERFDVAFAQINRGRDVWSEEERERRRKSRG